MSDSFVDFLQISHPGLRETKTIEFIPSSFLSFGRFVNKQGEWRQGEKRTWKNKQGEPTCVMETILQ